VKNVMVANYRPGSKVTLDQLRKLLDVQIENSIALGWKPDDVVVVANFSYEQMGVTATRAGLYERCLRGSKVFAFDFLFREGMADPDEVYWTHDLDAWQNHWFDCPTFADVGVAEYSRPRFNGGSVFYRHAARDIVAEVVRQITQAGADKEEPVLNAVLKLPTYRARVTILNSTFNVGCSGFVKRYQRATKPVLVCHMHPTNRIAWDTHVNDRNEIGERAVSPRLMELLVRRFHDGVPPRKLKRDRKQRSRA